VRNLRNFKLEFITSILEINASSNSQIWNQSFIKLMVRTFDISEEVEKFMKMLLLRIVYLPN